MGARSSRIEAELHTFAGLMVRTLATRLMTTNDVSGALREIRRSRAEPRKDPGTLLS
jgi:hypothetical protein